MRKIYAHTPHNRVVTPGAVLCRPAPASATFPASPLSDSPANPLGTPEGEGQDLAELLQALGFSHWHGLLESLMARYAGWLTHYWLDDRFNLDVWPQADVIRVLVNFPKALAGNDRAFALALSQCDFLVRLARDEASGEPWDALSQSYADFLSEHRQAEPFWGQEAPWPPEDFAHWALAQLQHRH